MICATTAKRLGITGLNVIKQFVKALNLLMKKDIVIEKINSETGAYENETIQYTGRSTHTLTGCTRGSSAPYRGVTPANTSAGTHSSGAKVYGSYLATAVSTTVIVGPKTSQTETQYNSLTVPLVSAASSTATGGGFNCTIGPVNDRG